MKMHHPGQGDEALRGRRHAVAEAAGGDERLPRGRPVPETKELVTGYTIIDVSSREQEIERRQARSQGETNR